MALAILEANLTSLAFTSPYVGPNGWDLLSYNTGEQVNVSWTTPWAFTNLQVWQPGEDGSFALNTLAANLTSNETSFMWNASTLDEAMTAEKVFFRLQKGDAPNTCERCTADSATFRLSDPNAQSSSSSTQTMSSTVMSSTVMSSTAMPTPAAASTSASPTPEPSGISEGARLGIGLGVGLGVGAILLVLGIFLFCLNRRKKRRHANPPTSERAGGFEETRTSFASAGADSWMSKHSSKQSYHSRFEFETPQGYVRPGSEELWSRSEKPSWLQRAPSKPKIPFFRS